MRLLEQPRLEFALQLVVGKNALSVNLVFEGCFLEGARLFVVVENFQEIIGAEIALRRTRGVRDLKIGLQAVDVGRRDQVQRAII